MISCRDGFRLALARTLIPHRNSGHVDVDEPVVLGPLLDRDR
jgi:hypothetical protein